MQSGVLQSRDTSAAICAEKHADRIDEQGPEQVIKAISVMARYLDVPHGSNPYARQRRPLHGNRSATARREVRDGSPIIVTETELSPRSASASTSAARRRGPRVRVSLSGRPFSTMIG